MNIFFLFSFLKFYWERWICIKKRPISYWLFHGSFSNQFTLKGGEWNLKIFIWCDETELRAFLRHYCPFSYYSKKRKRGERRVMAKFRFIIWSIELYLSHICSCTLLVLLGIMGKLSCKLLRICLIVTIEMI